MRHPTVMGGGYLCTGDFTNPHGCARTTYQYDTTTGKLAHVTQQGWTLDGAGAIGSFTYTTSRTYDTKGRLTSVDGPLTGAGDHDRITYTYKTSADPLNHGFLDTSSRYRVAYLLAADKYSRSLASRLIGVNQPVIRTQNRFSTLHPTQLVCI